MWIPAEGLPILCLIVPLLCVLMGYILGTGKWESRNSTKRFPKYGQSEDMRTKDKFIVKSRYKDNET